MFIFFFFRTNDDDKTSKQKYFALNIFDCKKSQHEEVLCHDHRAVEVCVFLTIEFVFLILLFRYKKKLLTLFKVFEATVVYYRIPYVVFGELREGLIDIIDNQMMVSHKYRLSDSSDEDERFGQYNRCEDFDDSSNEEESSDDEGPQYNSFGFEVFKGGIVKKRKSDKIAIHNGKLSNKLAEIQKRVVRFRRILIFGYINCFENSFWNEILFFIAANV